MTTSALQEHILQALSALPDPEHIFFIQIGSNDGVQGDPLRDLILAHPGWSGILVEPVPFVFHRLVENYAADPRLHFENIAIGPANGWHKFYSVDPGAVQGFGAAQPFQSPVEPALAPYVFNQMASFQREHLLRAFGPQIEAYIIESQVECLTFEALSRRHAFESFDLLHIDSEGFDYGILAQIDFDRFHPALILFEHLFLSAAEKQRAIRLLHRQDYTLSEYGADFLAVWRPSVR